MSPLRILFLIDSLRMGGAERVTIALLPHLDRQRVTPIICPISMDGESPLGGQLGDVTRRDLNAKRLLDPAAFARLLKVVDEEKIDLIHAQLQYATIFAAGVHWRKKTPVVVTRHLIGDDEFHWREKMRNRVEQWVIRQTVTKVISVSDAAKEHYRKLVNLPPERFITIYNGIDVDKFTPAEDKSAIRQNLNLPTDQPVVIMVGVMRQGKGQNVLIEAAKQVENAHFWLVGDGEERPNLEKQAAGLENRLHFLGQRMDIPDLLKAADLFVLPSDSEALPTVLIEAGAAGLPCIATRVGGIPEIIQDGTTGVIIPPRDPLALAQAMHRLLSEPEKIQQMGLAARQRILKFFTLPQQAEATMKLYEEIAR